MITNLLEFILDLLRNWVNAFTQYSTDVLAKLNLIEEDTSNLPDIKSNTDDIKDNTGAIINPINVIQGNSTTIASDTTSIKNTVSGMNNQLSTISTNVGTASAFAEDCATNTLNINNKVVTIASDTTQLRANSNTITSDLSDIKQALGYYIANTPVTEDATGDICNFDTDLEDYLQKLKVNIPSDLTGFTGITITKKGKNYIDDSLTYQQTVNQVLIGQTVNQSTLLTLLKAGTYTVSSSTSKLATMYYRHSDGYVSLGANTAPRTFTINEDMYVCFYLYTSAGLTTSDINWFLVECGETNSSYEPYKAITYPVSFGTTITDGAEIDLLTGLVKINTSPATYINITPIAIRTYNGVNNIYSDVGTTDLTYRETLKHYLDKQE